MKKIIISILSLIVLTGCFQQTPEKNTQNEAEKQSTQEQTEEKNKEEKKKEETTTVQEKSNKQKDSKVKAKTNNILEKHYTKSKRSYADLDLKLLTFSGPYQGIQKINDFYKNKYNYFYENLDMNLLQEMESQSSNSYGTNNTIIDGKNQNYWQMGHYEYIGQYGDFISVKGTLDGGQAGVSWAAQEGDVFNLNTGTRLKMKDLFSVSEKEYTEVLYKNLNAIMEKDIQNAQKQGDQISFFYIQEAKDAKEKKKLILEFDRDHFYFTDKGLVIEYQGYSLAPGAGGIHSFEIPYQNLSSILKDNIKKSVLP